MISGQQPIFAVICAVKLQETDGWPDFGSTAFQGFYYEKETAFNAVRENWCGIDEHCYDYAMIESILPGLYSYPRCRWFFKFNRKKGKYEPIDEPDFMKHIANIL